MKERELMEKWNESLRVCAIDQNNIFNRERERGMETFKRGTARKWFWKEKNRKEEEEEASLISGLAIKRGTSSKRAPTSIESVHM